MISRYIAIIYIGILFLGGCASILPSFENVSYNKNLLDLRDERAFKLTKRFLEYWHARAQGDYEKSWQYELPYQRYFLSFEKYRSLASGYKGSVIELKKIDFIAPDEAIVERKVFFSDKKGVVKKDKWYEIDGKWYHKFYQSILPPESFEEAEFQ